jgi:hypothetical protein
VSDWNEEVLVSEDRLATLDLVGTARSSHRFEQLDPFRIRRPGSGWRRDVCSYPLIGSSQQGF